MDFNGVLSLLVSFWLIKWKAVTRKGLVREDKRAHIVLLSAERLPAQSLLPQPGVSPSEAAPAETSRAAALISDRSQRWAGSW